MGVKVYLNKEDSNGIKCENRQGVRCKFGDPACFNPFRKEEEYCIGKTFTEITAAEFNASTGKKYRVKKDGRVLDYEPV